MNNSDKKKQPTKVVAETETIVEEKPKEVEITSVTEEVEESSKSEEEKKKVNPALIIVLIVVGVAIVGIVVTIFMTGLIAALLSETGLLSGMDMSGQDDVLYVEEELKSYCEDIDGAFTVGGINMFSDSGVAGLYSCDAKLDDEKDLSIALVALKEDFQEFSSNSNDSVASINAIIDRTANDSEDWIVLEDSDDYKAVIKRITDKSAKNFSYMLWAMEGRYVVRVYAADLKTLEKALLEIGFSELEMLDNGKIVPKQVGEQNAQIEEDLEDVKELLTKYMTNNRGNLPEIETATASGFESYIDGTGTSAWDKFYVSYFLMSDGNIEAPDGTRYQFRAFRSAQPDWAKDGEKMISVFYGSACRDGELDGGKKERRFALTYPKAGETGAYICVDNTY